MKQVKVYSTKHCPHCMRAKGLLSGKNIPFDDIDLSDDDALRESLSQKTGWQTVPMIFVGDEFIGGADELYALESAGQLDQKLKQ